MTDRAVVLAAGRGSRLRAPGASAATTAGQRRAIARGVKALVPVGPPGAERPIIDYLLAALADAGIRHVVVVASPDGEGALGDHTAGLATSPLTIDLAVQARPRGSAGALLAARAAIAGGGPFLVLGCDTWMPASVLGGLRKEAGSALPAFDRRRLLAADTNLDDQRLRGFAVLETDGTCTLRRIHEKPDRGTWSRLAEPVLLSLNAWRFEPSVFDACAEVAPSERGELELPAAVQLLVDRGTPVRVRPVEARALDLTFARDIQILGPLLAGVPCLR